MMSVHPAPTGPARPALRAALALGCALVLGATPAAREARAAETPPAAGALAPRWLTLKNGMRLLLVPDPRAAAVSVALWVEAGVRYERQGQVGISHLVEHLSAHGTAGEDETRRRIEAEGGISASFTTADFTSFTHTVPRSALETVLRLEAGRFALRPTQAMLDQARLVVREENRARARANPLELGLQRLYAAAFTSHPYRWPVPGLEDDLRRITVQDCERYLRARYTPDHALVTVVGDFDPDQALSLARRHLESIGGRGARDTGVPAEPEPGGGRRAVEPGELDVPLVVAGWRVPAASAAADAAALDVLATLLSGERLPGRLGSGKTASLFARAARDGQRDATVFWAAAAPQPGSDTAAVESALVAEVEKLASDPVSGEELDRARRQIQVSLLFGRQGTRDRGQAMGTAAIVSGDWREADRRLEQLRALTPDHLQRAAARTLLAARRTVVWLTPRSAPGGGPGGRP